MAEHHDGNRHQDRHRHHDKDRHHDSARGRRDVLAALSVLPLAALGWLSARASRPRTPRHYETIAPADDGLTVEGPVALWREGGDIGAVSRRCTHLGCELRAAGDGTLACPCHGSRFDGRGRVTRGPARADLRPLAVRVGPDGKVVVDLDG